MEDETSAHILCECETLASLRHAYLGSFFMEPRDIMYVGDSNENIKSAIKIQNTARLSCKLTIMILMV
jgi:hypothetical protein